MTSPRRRLESLSRRHVAAVVTDEQLMDRVVQGDQDAFTQLYDRYADRVFGLVRRVLRDPSQSEEVAQEVFVEVWRHARRFDSVKGTVTTWILTTAHRRAVDRVRSEQAARFREDRVAARDQVVPHDPVSEDVEVRLEQEQVRRALGGLTDLQRQAVELAYYGGNTYREVAVLLDTPLPTVKTRLRDGLIRMRDHLGVTS